MSNLYQAYFRHATSGSGVLWPDGKISSYWKPEPLAVLAGGFDEAMGILLGADVAAHLTDGDTVVLLNVNEPPKGGLRVFKLVREKPVDPPLTWVSA